jgi:hypothetical protein
MTIGVAFGSVWFAFWIFFFLIFMCRINFCKPCEK